MKAVKASAVTPRPIDGEVPVDDGHECVNPQPQRNSRPSIFMPWPPVVTLGVCRRIDDLVVGFPVEHRRARSGRRSSLPL